MGNGQSGVVAENHEGTEIIKQRINDSYRSQCVQQGPCCGQLAGGAPASLSRHRFCHTQYNNVAGLLEDEAGGLLSQVMCPPEWEV